MKNEPKKFVLKRTPPGMATESHSYTLHRMFDSKGPYLSLNEDVGDEIEVTIAPRKSVRERRAEVLEWVLNPGMASTQDERKKTALDALEAIEAIDRGERCLSDGASCSTATKLT